MATGGPRPAPGTLNELFFGAIEEFNRANALLYKTQGQWTPLSHRFVEERARHVALGLRALGLQPGDRVALLSENRPEWAIADYGCLTARLTNVPIYPTLPAEQLPYILTNSGAIAVFVSTALQTEKIARVRAQLPRLKWVISFANPAPGGADMSFDELLARGAKAETAESATAWKRDALTVRPDDLATLIYTSGTTGTPKGVMLSHDNLYSNVAAARTKLSFKGDDVELSFLPLSHVLQRHIDYLAWFTGTVVAYAESFDAVSSNMAEVRPTIVCAVPRLYEKIYARVVENAMQGGAVRKHIFLWARRVGARWTDARLAGRTIGPWTALQYRLAHRLVFSKLQQRLGGRLRYFVSGGAALAPEINKFFYAAGLTILEGYGLTETSPVLCVNTPEHYRIGTVGQPINGVELRIAPDGEILARSPGVMKGYYDNPAATEEVIDQGGWFHTGDIGAIEDDFLRITDRKKDLIKTSGGKYIAPQVIEGRAKLNEFVSEAVLIGEGRKFPSMLVVPNFGRLEQWAASQNISQPDHTQLLKVPAVHAKMEAEVTSAFRGLASFETPKRIALLEHEFTVDGGELTPSLKVKRKAVDQKYKEIIDGLYA